VGKNMSFITSQDQWLKEYRKNKQNIWIVPTCYSTTYYLKNNTEWLEFVKFCNTEKLTISSIGLQYRSHSISVDTSDCDGVYVVRSLIGMMGEKSKETITIGKLQNDIVYKTMWVTPELIEQLKTEDHIEECFKEALAFNHEKTDPKTRIIQ
jgi:hypothetical protein